MNTTKALLTGAFSLLSLLPATAGTYTTTTDKNVVQTQPQPPAEPCAGPISYSNVELLYTYTDFDVNFGDDNANGGRIAMEWALNDRFYLAVGADYMAGDDVDLWIINGGVGAAIPLTENIHAVIEGGALWVDLEYDDAFTGTGSDSESDWGWYAKPHLRGKWGCFEAQLGAVYRDLGDFNPGDSDGRWAGFGKLFYHLNQNWDVTAGVLFDEDMTQWSGGLRWRF